MVRKAFAKVATRYRDALHATTSPRGALRTFSLSAKVFGGSGADAGKRGMEVRYSQRARKQLAKLDAAIRQRIMAKLREYADNPAAFANNVTALRGRDAAGYRLRVGDYRAVFTLHDGSPRLLFVYRIGHRRDVYER